MFGRKKSKVIVPYSSNNKITPSNGAAAITTSDKQPPTKDTNIDALNQLRDTQTVTNSEYITISLLKEMLLKLNQIEVNTRSTAVSSEFLGRHILTRFKWL